MRWPKSPDPKATRDRVAMKIDDAALRRDVEMYPDVYQYERAQRFGISTRDMCNALQRLKINRNKKP